MATKQIRGINTGYDDVGGGDPLVLVHGHPFSRSMWRDQIAGFGRRCRVVAPDLRGFGESEAVEDKTTLEEFARDIGALLDELGLEDVVLCGLSMGGQIALEFYRLFPQRVRALVLADTFAQLDDDARRRWRYETADRLVREGMGRYAEEVLPKMIAPRTISEQPEVAARVLEMMRTTPPRGAAAALRGRAERRDYTPLLPRIAAPTLVIVGSEDVFTPVDDAKFMRDRIPGSRMAVIEGAGHMPNMEKPLEFNRAVAGFMEALN